VSAPSVLVALQEKERTTRPTGEASIRSDFEVVLQDRRILSVVTFFAPNTGATFSKSDVTGVVTAQADLMSGAQNG
jgi:hypothetical protein